MTNAPTYLDYAASAPLRPEVAELVNDIDRGMWGNPSSIHAFGRAAVKVLDESRAEIASVLGCMPAEVVFTSGGTESDNLAIIGLAKSLRKGTLVTTTIEHKAVLNACEQLAAGGWRVKYVAPTKEGLVTVASVLAAIDDDTSLVSVMYANNEIGTIQPIREIGKEIERLNKARRNKVYFHCDAVQGATLLPLNVAMLHVDMLTISAHKLGGPKGVGCLFVRNGVPLSPIIAGGGQEAGLRSGTVNVSGAAGLARALQITNKNRGRETARLKSLQDWLVQEVRKIPGAMINGSLKYRLASNLNFSIKNKPSDEMVIALDRKGIAVSAASACASGSISKSYVIEALGVPEWRATNSLRVSMGYMTRKADLAKLLRALR